MANNNTNDDNDNDLAEPLLASSLLLSLEEEQAEAAQVISHDTTGADALSDDDHEEEEAMTTTAALRRQTVLFFKVLYFLNGLSASTWGRFGVIFYNQVCGLRATQIGWLQAVAPLVSTLCMPLWGVVADAWSTRKHVYLFTKACNTASLLSLAVVPAHNFGTVMAAVVGMAAFRSSGVLDAAVLDVLGTAHQGKYGSIRLYTALSWGLGAVLMGYITDRYGFVWNFCLYGGMMVGMMLLIALYLPARSHKEQALYEQRQQGNHPAEEPVLLLPEQGGEESPLSTDAHNSSSLAPPRRANADWAELKQAMLRLPVVVWITQVVVIGTGMALVDSFLFVYLQNDLHASTRLCGWTVGVTVLLELPLFYYSERLLKRMGHDGLMTTSMMAYAVRAAGYTYLTPSTVHWVLLLEILHGVTFAGMWMAAVDFAATVAPPAWTTTVQTVLSASFGCLGPALGSAVGGWILERHTAVVLYRGMAVVVGVVWLVHVVTWWGCGYGHDAFLKSIVMERRNTGSSGDGSSALSESASTRGEDDVEGHPSTN